MNSNAVQLLIKNVLQHMRNNVQPRMKLHARQNENRNVQKLMNSNAVRSLIKNVQQPMKKNVQHLMKLNAKHVGYRYVN